MKCKEQVLLKLFIEQEECSCDNIQRTMTIGQ